MVYLFNFGQNLKHLLSSLISAEIDGIYHYLLGLNQFLE